MPRLYTYYLFYLLKEIDMSDRKPGDLYAYTDTKAYAKRFKKERDMTKFYMEKKELSTSEISKLTTDYADGFLVETKVHTRIHDHPACPTMYMILQTVEEYKLCTHNAMEYFTSDIFKYVWTDPSIFNKSVLKALTSLRYVNGYRMLADKRCDFTSFDLYTQLHEDFVAVFVHYYKDILKG